ncbi:MAG TPA: hypothetical protein VNJ01_09840 [Bacteriovoracaceae bacterium]|nr:hypothetical protein [Bacteriovoracaceae bacterium]
MKKNHSFLRILSLSSFLGLASCVGVEKPVVTPGNGSTTSGVDGGADGGADGGTNGGTTGIDPQALNVKSVRVKNYNQYNTSLEKMTGINRSVHNELFNALKGSLPADNQIAGMTPFNLIAMSRLADAYCTSFVDLKFSKSEFPATTDEAIAMFIATFLDTAPASQPEYYQALSVEMEKIYDSGTLFPEADTNPLLKHRNSSIAACVVVLASPYVTLLE